MGDNEQVGSENWHRGSWMQTYTGKKFYPTAPRVEDIDILDIAHSLSMQCRYNGHVHTFYSVAEHCLLMSLALQKMYPGEPELWLEALLHDATEAYVGDMVRPLKIQMPSFSAAEEVVAIAIGEKFNLPQSCAMSSKVKDADNRILLNERAALLGTPPAEWSVQGQPLDIEILAFEPKAAKYWYLRRYVELTGEAVVNR